MCSGDFLERVEAIAKSHPKAIVLREKDLPEPEYTALARRVIEICRDNGTKCILHNFTGSAAELKWDAIHLPLHKLREMTPDEKQRFSVIGASCHSVAEAIEAVSLGCSYITAGHVFETDCKKGLPGRGIEFLKDVCGSVSIPVFAIGGISKTNFADVKAAGAAGACVMSGFMTCDDTDLFMEGFENEI